MAQQMAIDSEGFCLEIAKKMELTTEEVRKLVEPNVDISSLEDFFRLTEEELESLFQGIMIKQKIAFRRWKEQYQKEPEQPPATAHSPLPQVRIYVLSRTAK